MANSKSVFVSGATGNQGGSVARNLAAQGYHVRALVRDPASMSAQKLKHPNIEIVKGDLNDINSYKDLVKGMDVVYSVQTFIHGVKKEIDQGLQLTNVAREHGISHLIYSSVVGADLATGVPHWESKGVIEKHIKQSGIPYTIIRPSSFYENFLFPQVKSRIVKGKFVVPLNKNSVQQMMSAEDVGFVVPTIMRDLHSFESKIITLGVEQMDQEEVARTFSRVLGKEVRYQRLPSLITRMAMGGNLYKMFKWVDKNNAIFIEDLAAVQENYPGLENLDHWIARKFI